ncbi:hypothetical protein T4D_1378 [Trichinella pseudospiralis]|uniref:Uncharacterized protein n=1 Tax=Trichinella pseudospiralis TaxID=6337 RepID=A0A0V1FC63_TRIPS|nr:hypothetical protein T4D_1378 [Trichinella pseudospiralis]
MVGWRELTGGMPPPSECSRDMPVLWQQQQNGLIWRHRRRLMTEEGAKQALVPRALKNEVLQKGKRDEPVQFHGRRHNIVVVKY